jgi:hypothetical protein
VKNRDLILIFLKDVQNVAASLIRKIEGNEDITEQKRAILMSITRLLQLLK